MENFEKEAEAEGLGPSEAAALAGLCEQHRLEVDSGWLAERAAEKSAGPSAWREGIVEAVRNISPKELLAALARARAEGAGDNAFNEAFEGQRAFDVWLAAAKGAPPADVVEVALIMDENGAPMRDDAPTWKAADPAELRPWEIRAERLNALASWSERGWKEAPAASAALEAMLALAESWMGVPAEGGISHRDWQSAIGVDYNRQAASKHEWSERLEMAAAFCNRFGVGLGDAGWENALSMIDMAGEPLAAAAVEKVLLASAESIGPRAAGLIVGLAISCDNARLMALAARRATALHWRLPQACWELADRYSSEDSDEARKRWESPLPAIHAALLPPRDVGQGGLVSGRDCFEALAAQPKMLAGALANPCPYVFKQMDLKEVLSIHKRLPGLLDPDAEGLNFAHHWANMGIDEVCISEMKALLNSPLSEMALAKNKAGEAPVDRMRARLGAACLQKWDAGFALWEARAVKAAAGRAKPAAKRKAGPRL